jgi:hypothetical protein
MVGVCTQPFFNSYCIKPERTLVFDNPKFEDGVLQTVRELNGKNPTLREVFATLQSLRTRRKKKLAHFLGEPF